MSSSARIFSALNVPKKESQDNEIIAEKGDDFSYHEINKIILTKISNNEAPRHDYNGYTASVNRADAATRDFIYFLANELKESNPKKIDNEGELLKRYRLKFHISLPEDNEEMRELGWQIIKNSLIKNNVNTFKVIQKGKFVSEDKGEEGKDITVYAEYSPEFNVQDWRRIFQNMTQDLVDAGVRPGYRPPGTLSKPEKPLSGSNYVSYRYEGERKKSIKHKGAVIGWPDPDPVAGIQINVQNQAGIPAFVPKQLQQTGDKYLEAVSNNTPSQKLR